QEHVPTAQWVAGGHEARLDQVEQRLPFVRYAERMSERLGGRLCMFPILQQSAQPGPRSLVRGRQLQGAPVLLDGPLRLVAITPQGVTEAGVLGNPALTVLLGAERRREQLDDVVVALRALGKIHERIQALRVASEALFDEPPDV